MSGVGCSVVTVFDGAGASVDSSKGVLRFLGMIDTSEFSSSKSSSNVFDSNEIDNGRDNSGGRNAVQDD